MIDLAGEARIFAISTSLFLSLLFTGTRLFGTVLRGSFLISTFHAITILILTASIVFSECWDTFADFCRFDSVSNSDLQQFTLLFSMGYFLVDSFVVLYLAPDASAALHHVSILVGLIATIFSGEFVPRPTDRYFSYTGSSGYPLACFLFAAEISAPFLNAFLSGLVGKDSKLEFIAKAMFAFTFLVSRLIICPFLTYEFVVNSPNASAIPKAVCVFVMCISIYWSRAIIAGIIEALNPPPKKAKEEYMISEQPDGRLKGQ